MRRRGILPAAILAAFCAPVLAQAVAQAPADPAPADRAPTDPAMTGTGRVARADAAVQHGQQVMTNGGAAGMQGACLSCHGVDGGGDAAGAFPRLAGQPAGYLFKQLQDYASGARSNEIMSPIASQLTEDERRDVALYYAIQAAPAPSAPRNPDPALVQWGGVLSAIGSADRNVQACQNCHGPAGTGLPPRYPALAGQVESYLENQLRLWRSGERDNDPADLMQGLARHLTDEDIRAAATYFANLRPAGAPPQR
jgi:cytochrome c553